MGNKTYDIFIGHAWARNHERSMLKRLLNDYQMFKWRDVSSPLYDPFIDTGSPEGKSVLLGLIEKSIEKAECVLILPGTNVTYQEWIQAEVMFAKKSAKPVILVLPQGVTTTPEFMKEAANEVVGWSAASIVAAIRNCINSHS